MPDTTLTLIGNLTGDPELRFTPNGSAVVNFTIASTPRQFDKTKQEWVDGEALFMRCSLWRQPAEHVAESLVKGSRVIATGRLRQRSYEKNGEKKTVLEFDVDEIGASLKFAAVKPVKANPTSSPKRADPDPWDSGFGSGNDEPPF